MSYNTENVTPLTGHERRAAEEEALHEPWASWDALTAYEDANFTSATVVRLAVLGETLVGRLVELRSQGED